MHMHQHEGNNKVDAKKASNQIPDKQTKVTENGIQQQSRMKSKLGPKCGGGIKANQKVSSRDPNEPHKPQQSLTESSLRKAAGTQQQ